MVQNRKKHWKNSHLIIHFPTSEGVSEVSAAERTSEASRAEQANEWAVQANEQMDKRVTHWVTDPVLHSRFLVILAQNGAPTNKLTNVS